jgi:hypothetical protein
MATTARCPLMPSYLDSLRGTECELFVIASEDSRLGDLRVPQQKSQTQGVHRLHPQPHVLRLDLTPANGPLRTTRWLP